MAKSGLYLDPNQAIRFLSGVKSQLFGETAPSPVVPSLSTPEENDQVWPLIHFFLFPFCENSLICLEGKSMTPRRGNTILFRSSQQLPRLRLGPLKGFLS